MGRVTGGRVFGYRNRTVYKGEDVHGRPLRSHVERDIDPIEKLVVQRIFELYDSGSGLKRIAKLLNSGGAAKPKPFVRKDGLPQSSFWSPSTVNAILRRELYHGIAVWNKSRKRDDWGQKFSDKKKQRRPKSEELRTAVEHLRIIPEELWLRVRERRADVEHRTVRFSSGRLSGQPPKHTTINLLAGLATCGLCGGGLVVETSPRKRGRVPEYVCARHRTSSACVNTLHVAKSVMDEAVLQAIEEHVLTPEAIEQVISLSEHDENAERGVEIAREPKTIERRIVNVTEAIAEGNSPAALLAKLRELEAKKAELAEMAASLKPLPRLAVEVVEARLEEWRRMLRQSPTQARAVIQRVIDGRITFTPEGTGYVFSAKTRFSKLFSGVATPMPSWAKAGDVRGTKHLTVNDTMDADYGRLLERAEKRVLGVTSPTGFEPVFWP